ERVAERPAAVRRIVEAGGEVANHTMEERATILMDDAEFERSLERADALIEPFGDPVWFRPGHGWFDRRMVAEAAAEGYGTALASMLPLDGWLPVPALVAPYVLHSARPGAVLILHDDERRGDETAEVLRRVLPELARRGYRVTTLSELAGVPPAARGEAR
ncbi:MAG TPA: polysaccharide deacetylase family protein, partial [Gemmatimonadota bacterium]|nr:polysaccharide deacetylase family protein [Gemmatimonadota bacterium]